MADLGFALGKMRLTDRIGGYLRPKFKEEVRLSRVLTPGSRMLIVWEDGDIPGFNSWRRRHPERSGLAHLAASCGAGVNVFGAWSHLSASCLDYVLRRVWQGPLPD
jgi:hypothetical protein